MGRGRGRGSGNQRNQATISRELQKYSRSRTGKGMNSREVAGCLDPRRGGRDVASCRWQASTGGGSSPAAGEQDQTSPRVFAGGGARCRSAGVGGLASGTEGDVGVHACLLGWAVSNGQIRIGSRAQYSLN